MNTCSVCGMRRPCEVTITIENGEGAAMGIEDGTEFHYCKPCWKLLQDKQTAAAMLQGQTADFLRAIGHPMPNHASQRLYDFLMEQGKKPV